ncbi:type II secretion system F family protein [Ornithinimicrobium tianjinense]|uniref:Type II secretion system protein GspF domain-containing protein n=1 Tax=Ornithinimicrobium tianjinense TaxID=1195761 RepID=A0A917EZP2_9MICO|nr:type II secretion system F family protein [Ornithinimicrobium tianjinense]GGF37487.1 hypothetical protein GCM10011366_01250 [Ornithinimicrobium tianjinense]
MSESVQLLCAAALAVAGILSWPSPPRRWSVTTRPPPASGGVLGTDARRGTAGGTGGRHLVPEALELIALALGGGASVVAAVAEVASTLPAPLGAELGQVASGLAGGDDPVQVWERTGDHWAPARRALGLAEAAGVAPTEALLAAAADLRRDAVADVEVATARLAVRLVLPLGLAYLPAFVLTTVVPLVLALVRDLS